MKYYIATSLSNMPQHNELRDQLQALGHEITYDWTTHGPAWPHGVVKCAEVSQSEINGVKFADAVVVLLPGGRGTHIEIGAALAYGKQVFLWSPDKAVFECDENACAFYYNPFISARLFGGQAEMADLAQFVHEWFE